MIKIKFLKKNISYNLLNYSNFLLKNRLVSISSKNFVMGLNLLNRFRNTKKESDVDTRFNELKEKIGGKKNKIANVENETEDNDLTVNELFAKKIYERFIKFYDNNDKFTWQMNLELIKLASGNNDTILWSKYIYYEQQYLQQLIEELTRFISCLSEQEEDKKDFKRYELKNISTITGIPLFQLHFIIYNFKYYSLIFDDYKKKRLFNKPFFKSSEELLFAITNDEFPEFRDLRKYYVSFIQNKIGFSNDFCKRMNEKKSRRNYEKIKNTNSF